MATHRKKVFKEDDEVLDYLESIEKPTTYLNDYKKPILDPEPDKSVYENLAISRKKTKEVSKFSTGELKSSKTPFNVFIKPRPILDDFNLSTIEVEVKKFLNRKKPTENFDRPRVFKCPEVSLDDIPDKNVRDMIINYMYSTETKNSFQNIADKTYLRNEKTGLEDWKYNKTVSARTDSKKIMWLKEVNEEVSRDNWDNVAAKEWAFNNPRFLGQPTKNFWAKKEVLGASYNPLENLIDSRYGEYITDLWRNNQLRLPHIKTDSSYDGFKPQNVSNIPVKKTIFTPSDFWFTTNQYYGYTAPSNNEAINKCSGS